MAFTTQIFLFIFFPICLGVYKFIELIEKNHRIKVCSEKLRVKDSILIIFSLGFYMWAVFDDIFRFVLYILFVYMIGNFIQKYRAKKVVIMIEDGLQSNEILERKKVSKAVPVLWFSIFSFVFCLVCFKYTYILADVWNFLFHREVVAQSYLAPLGISFITFSAISYVVDIYRGDADAGNLFDCFLYMSFFPKVVSGPIVLWKDYNKQISNRRCSVDSFVEGINRIMIGFAKKLILADQFGAFIAEIPLEAGSMDSITAFASMFAYMLQIYFDFSGYSDIAIGIAKLFGFEFKENFNFPYVSKSVSEFWRRWHISLGTWFREYVYIPLGGSRCNKKKIIRNQAVVFLLTGIWHGAGWNYLLWGALNGFFVITERLISTKKYYKKTPNIIKWFSTMFITFVAWQFFRFSAMSDTILIFKSLFAQYSLEHLPYTWQYFLDLRIILLMTVGIVGATVCGFEKVRSFCKKFTNTSIGFILQETVLVCCFLIAILCMVNSTYSPFIYFQY